MSPRRPGSGKRARRGSPVPRPILARRRSGRRAAAPRFQDGRREPRSSLSLTVSPRERPHAPLSLLSPLASGGAGGPPRGRAPAPAEPFHERGPALEQLPELLRGKLP